MGTDEIDEIDDLIERFFAAIEAGDRATIADLYADDIEVWHSTTDLALDKATALAVLDWLMAPGVTRRYREIERIVVGGRVSRRHVLTVGVPGHDDVTMPVSIYLTLADGRITRIDEYVDAKGTDRLFELIPFPGT